MALGNPPVWATSGLALITIPTTPEQQIGWTTNTGTAEGIGEIPPLQYFNWWQNAMYEWALAATAIIGPITGLGTMASQNANAVAITGGTINGTILGGSTPAAGTFTHAFDSGSAPTTAAQLANKAYVDGTVVLGGSQGELVLGNGFILKWGSTTMGSGGTTVTYTTAFPNATLNVVVSGASGSAQSIGFAVNSISSGSVAISGSGGTYPISVFWQAIGW